MRWWLVQHDPSRVLEDLRGVVRGELLFDDLASALYSTDASIYQIQPLGVVVPADEVPVMSSGKLDLRAIGEVLSSG